MRLRSITSPVGPRASSAVRRSTPASHRPGRPRRRGRPGRPHRAAPSIAARCAPAPASVLSAQPLQHARRPGRAPGQGPQARRERSERRSGGVVCADDLEHATVRARGGEHGERRVGGNRRLVEHAERHAVASPLLVDQSQGVGRQRVIGDLRQLDLGERLDPGAARGADRADGQPLDAPRRPAPRARVRRAAARGTACAPCGPRPG